jgi:small subunit ribosomal protein S11
MGKKRIVSKGSGDSMKKSTTGKKTSKKRISSGVLHVQASYNNTIVTLTDSKGNKVASSSSGSLGFRGAKKGTPFAAAKIGEVLSEKAEQMGMQEVAVIIRGVGSGRESAVRSFVNNGITISSIKDATPVPHNGPKPPKPRRI